MGRHANAEYRPFRSKRDGVEYGNFRWYNPFTKAVETISPETDDATTAWERTRTLLEMGTGNGRGGQAGEVPEATTDTPEPTFSKMAGEAVDAWVKKDEGQAGKLVPPNSGSNTQATVANPSITQTPSGTGTTLPSTNTPLVSRVATKQSSGAKKGGLTPEQSARMAKGMKSLVVKVNLMSLGGIVRFAGKEPYALDEEDIELLELGWELTLDEYFVKNPPKPWMLILAGNVMCATVMYMRGETIVKEEDITITEGEPQGAPGHGRNAT